MKKFRLLFTAILGLLLFSCQQKDMYFSHEGGDQGLEVTAKFEKNNPLPEGLDGDIYSFSFTAQEQLFNAYHGVNPYNPPFVLPMDAGIYDMLFMTSDMNNIENLTLNWGEDNEDKCAEPAYFEFANVEQEGANGYEFINSPFKDKEWYMGTMFVEHASSYPAHTAQPPVWMASYESGVEIEQAAQAGVSQTVPTGKEGDAKITKLTTYPQQMVFQPTFTVEISGLTDVDAVYMSVAALEGGAPLIPGYGHNAQPITYEAQMELTDNGDGTYTATKQFNTFGLDGRASQFGETGGGNVCIVVENSATGAACDFSSYNFDVAADEARSGKTMIIKDELEYNVTSINIVEENLQFTIDPTQVQDQTLTLEYNPTNAVNKGVTWSSDNEKAVTVDQDGKITIVGIGEAKITATLNADNSITDFCDVTVGEQVIDPESLLLEPGRLQFIEGELESQELLTVFYPDNATNKAVTWSYSKDGLVTVTEKDATTFDVNITKAAKAGDVITITATSVANPSLSADCEITVEGIPTTELNIVEEFIPITIDPTQVQTQQLTLEFEPTNTTDRAVTWSSNNEKAVTVDQYGMIKVVGEGRAVIKVSLNSDPSIMDVCDVSVSDSRILVTDINFDNLANGLHLNKVGETFDLSKEVTVLPTNATNKTLSWSVVSGDDVVSINQTTGMVEALNPGMAVIRASATDGSGVTQDLNVKVWKPTYTITFDAQGGDPTGSTWVTDENGTLVSSWLSIPTPTLQGVDFVGWFTEPKGGTKVTDATVFTQNATVYAQWQSKGILVTDIQFLLTSGTIDLTLVAGRTVSFDLGAVTTVLPDNATDKSLEWSVDSGDAVSVNSNGVITALKAGIATVTATAKDGSGVSESVTVNVLDPTPAPVTVSSVEITTESGSGKDFSLKMGENKTLAATVSMSDGTSTNSVTWSSANSDIASVDATGKVTAKAVGSVVITATSTADSSKNDTLTVTVTTTGIVIPPIS